MEIEFRISPRDQFERMVCAVRHVAGDGLLHRAVLLGQPQRIHVVEDDGVLDGSKPPQLYVSVRFLDDGTSSVFNPTRTSF